MKIQLKITILLFALLSLCSFIQAQQLAFPGAEGYGRFTTGGRGGAVYIVTKLTDDGSVGTLRWAINQVGARTVVFAISGTIHLTSKLRILEDSITIAGQTAPGDGICLADYTLSIDADNVIIRYIRSRMGSVYMNEDDAMSGTGNDDIIIDHCSMSWSIDECGSFYDNLNFTMQWCLLAESLYASGHVKGNHGYGGIWGGLGASFHHNLLSSHTSRNPRFCGARYHDTSPETEIVDFRNNVIFNWGFNSAYGGELGQQNMVNNYYKAGPATQLTKKNRIVQIDRGSYANPGKWYIDGNYVNGYPDITANNWAGGAQGADAANDSFRVYIPFPFAPVTTQTAEDAYVSVLANVGATLPKRDVWDTRIVSEVQTEACLYGDSWGANSGIIDLEINVGGWPILNSLPALIDTDLDGMPDNWETDNGLNPNDASDRNIVGGDGYTKLESYLNSLGVPTGIENIQLTQAIGFSCNPTLVENIVTISYNAIQESTTKVSISTLTGQKVLTKVLTNKSGNITESLDLGALSPGIYFCTLQSEHTQQSIKLIKK